MKKLAIFSVPRSGSTWLGEIFNSSPNTLYRFQPNFAYSFPLELNKNSSTEQIEIFHKKLENCDDPFVCAKLSISGQKKDSFPKKSQNTLVWKETHFIFLAETLLRNSDAKVIGLVRSPFATVASWLKVPKEFNPNWNVSEQWRYAELKNEGEESHYFGFEKWKEATLLFEHLKKEFPNRFYLVSYDDLLEDTVGTVTNLFSFADLELTDQTLQFLMKSRSASDKDAYGVFKRKENDEGWKMDLPGYIVKAIKSDPDFMILNKKYSWVE